jgi:hypothetical protein
MAELACPADLGERWLPQLVATAAENRLNIWRNQRASLAAESIECQPIDVITRAPALCASSGCVASTALPISSR